LSHPPLLYGPYVIYAALDGNWYRVRYDLPTTTADTNIKTETKPKPDTQEPYRELIKIPHKAGWKIVSIKNANWRFWTLVLQHPQSKLLEEYWLLQ
jgi:hypothetical protein